MTAARKRPAIKTKSKTAAVRRSKAKAVKPSTGAVESLPWTTAADLDKLSRDFDYHVQRQTPDSFEALVWFGVAFVITCVACVAIYVFS